MSFLDTIDLPKRQLALAAGALALLLVILLTVYLVWFRAPYKVLFADLRTADAATIVAELDKKKIAYRLADGGKTILVPAKLADATRLGMVGEDLPLKGTVGFELFNKSDMGLTEFAQQVNYRRALQGELARTIMGLEGIESCRVHLSLTQQAVFRDDQKPSKASVTLMVRKGQTLDEAVVSGVQSLVAAAVPDLQTDHVVVLDARGVVVSRNRSAEQATVTPTGRLEVEEAYADAISVAVRQVYREGQLHVLVSAPGAPEPSLADAAASLSPARAYPLKVKVLVEHPLAPDVKAEIQQRAIAVAGLDPALGDTLMVAPLTLTDARGTPGATPASTAPPAQTEALPTPRRSVMDGMRRPVILWPLIACGLGLLLLVAWRLPPHRGGAGRRLTHAQKTAYTLRLRRLLAEEDDRVTSGL